MHTRYMFRRNTASTMKIQDTITLMQFRQRLFLASRPAFFVQLVHSNLQSIFFFAAQDETSPDLSIHIHQVSQTTPQR